MIEGYSPLWQAALGTFFTWFVTAAGSAIVFISHDGKELLDASLGFSAGVMLAASYWSLLAPAIEAAEESGNYGEDGEWSFVPVSVGFAAGAWFVYACDDWMSSMGMGGSVVDSLTSGDNDDEQKPEKEQPRRYELRNRKTVSSSPASKSQSKIRNNLDEVTTQVEETKKISDASWKRTLLLAMAVTIHNIPEGLAVGVGFGAIGTVKSATFAKARNLAIGIGIQNFPEGLAVSLPLHRAGYSKWRAFFYGQMSGMVEPVAGIAGAMAVSYATPMLPFALAFAAGAMVFVVLDDIVPEYMDGENQKLGSAGAILGFIVMMSLDVGLG